MKFGLGKLPGGIYLVMLAAIAIALLAACAPAAAPAPTTTQATPAAAATTAPKPAAAPTTSAAAPTGAPIKIGYLTPLTGATAPFGHLEKVSISLAEEDISKAGGINGSPLQIIRYDSPFDPTQAVTLVRKLAGDDKAFAILG
ncbi:MAG: ABC transporter substrate-binding protein, partial [Dehalococcoidia bacterium]|nr:ABC transporter substrate-binding protein [Dehalococcoidia bacterium]